MKHNEGLPQQQIDLNVGNNTETITTNTDSRWTNDDLGALLSTSTMINDTSRPSFSKRPTVEILRANSPTLKRLLAVRNKLDKHLYALSSAKAAIAQATYSADDVLQPLKSGKQIAITKDTNAPTNKEIHPRATVKTGPLDKVTYEQTCTQNGHVKQKCSVEIWLPKFGAENDDETRASRAPSPAPTIDRQKNQSPHSVSSKNRQNVTIRVSTTTTTGNLKKHSTDDDPPKRPDPIVIPRLYHYEDYLRDHLEERPRSARSNQTVKSDNNKSNRSAKRPHINVRNQQHATSNNRPEEMVRPVAPLDTSTSKNPSTQIKKSTSHDESKFSQESSHGPTIQELMKKYSGRKQRHHEPNQSKQSSEKETRSTKDNSMSSLLSADSTSLTSSDHPIVSIKKLSSDKSLSHSFDEQTSLNKKLSELHLSTRKSSNHVVFSQTRLFSIVKHLQQRQTSATMSTTILPAVVWKKKDDPSRSLQRSKTLDVTIEDPINVASNVPMPSENQETASVSSSSSRRTNKKYEQKSLHRSKRNHLPAPLPVLRSEQQPQQVCKPLIQLVQYQNVQNSAQRYHNPAQSTINADSPTNKVFVHLKYSSSGTIDRDYLVNESTINN